MPTHQKGFVPIFFLIIVVIASGIGLFSYKKSHFPQSPTTQQASSSATPTETPSLINSFKNALNPTPTPTVPISSGGNPSPTPTSSPSNNITPTATPTSPSSISPTPTVVPTQTTTPTPTSVPSYTKSKTFYGSPDFELTATCTAYYPDTLSISFKANALKTQGYQGLWGKFSEGTYSNPGTGIHVVYQSDPPISFSFNKTVSSIRGAYETPSITLVGDNRSYLIRVYSGNFTNSLPTLGPLAGELAFSMDCTK